MGIFNELCMTSLATGHSPVLGKDSKCLHPTIFTKSKSPPSGPPKVCRLLKLNFASFRDSDSPMGTTFSMTFILVSHNPLATRFSRCVEVTAWIALKSNFINTLFSQQMVVIWCLELVKSQFFHLKGYLIRYAKPAPTPATPAKASSQFLMPPSMSCTWKNSTNPSQPLCFTSQSRFVLTRTSVMLSAKGSMQLSWLMLFKCLATKAPKEMRVTILPQFVIPSLNTWCITRDKDLTSFSFLMSSLRSMPWKAISWLRCTPSPTRRRVSSAFKSSIRGHYKANKLNHSNQVKVEQV